MPLSLVQVGAPTVLDLFEHIQNTVGDIQVKQACGNIHLADIEGPRSNNTGVSG